MKFCVSSIAALALISASASLAAQQNWTVKPEWVSAHESFLASDVLAGRGSATRDEELTATYVASEFESYGLKTAPGMTSYLQSAEIVSPELDGHATLTVLLYCACSVAQRRPLSREPSFNSSGAHV